MIIWELHHQARVLVSRPLRSDLPNLLWLQASHDHARFTGDHHDHARVTGFFLPTSQALPTGLQPKVEVKNSHHHIYHDHGQVSEVLESRNPRFPPGSYVVAYTGWRELAVVCYRHHCHHHCHHTGCFFKLVLPKSTEKLI